MNNLRRAHLTRISDKLAELKEEVLVILDLEWEDYDDLPELPENFDRRDKMKGILSDLEDAYADFEHIIECLAAARGEV